MVVEVRRALLHGLFHVRATLMDQLAEMFQDRLREVRRLCDVSVDARVLPSHIGILSSEHNRSRLSSDMRPSVIGRGQEDDLVFVVDLVEDAPASNSDSPRRGLPIAQPRSRRNLTRGRSKERVENYHHFAMTRNDELLWPEACTFQLEEAKNMKNVDLPMPLFGFIIATRAILGAGIGLLLGSPRRSRYSAAGGRWEL